MSVVVIPAAGRGTRFAPYTRLIPKELLPLGNRAALDYIFDEIMHAGITHTAIITHASKPLIAQYCAQQPREIRVIEQQEPLGLGHAVLMAEPAVQEDFFGVCLPDDIIMSTTPCIQLLKEYSEHYHASVIAVQKVLAHEISSYGVIKIKQELTKDLFELSDVVEKPRPEAAPSPYAIMGRYWLSREIFAALKAITPGVGRELQLTDALRVLIQRGYPVLALEIPGTRYDLGTPAGWLKANQDTIARW